MTNESVNKKHANYIIAQTDHIYGMKYRENIDRVVKDFFKGALK